MMRFDIPILGYRGHEPLARNISLEVEPGSCILLAGTNGSGKSTLLRALAASEPRNFLLPTGIPKVKGFTVREFIRTGCFKESGWAGRLSAGLSRRMEEALNTLGISDLGDRDLSTLSDGQFQKACLAIALTRQAQLLLLDEPTAFLDVSARRSVLHTLRDLTRSAGISVIFSSHDLADALPVIDRLIGLTPDHRFLSSAPASAPSPASPLSPEAVLEQLFPN